MRLTLRLLGVEVLDIAINEPETADEQDIEPEFEPYQDAGSTTSTAIGFTRSVQPDWERPLNGYDEPGEDD